jgi:hypothetical protein
LDLPAESWHWFYQRVPDGPAIIVVAENDEGIVGHYAVQPRPFRLRAATCLAGLAVGTMVHPSARDVTTLVEMAHLAYDLSRERGLAFLYAFPNDHAYRIRRMLLRWHTLPQVMEWEGALPSSAWDLGSRARIWETPPLSDGTYSSLPVDELSRDAICGQRSPEWLRWRFFENPEADYVFHVVETSEAVRGYAVSKRYQRDGVWYGHIVDWQVGSPDGLVERQLIGSVWQQFAKWQVERGSCWALPKSSLYAQLRDAGLTQTGRRTNFTYLPLSPEMDTELASEEAWSIHMGDSDVY